MICGMHHVCLPLCLLIMGFQRLPSLGEWCCRFCLCLPSTSSMEAAMPATPWPCRSDSLHASLPNPYINDTVCIFSVYHGTFLMGNRMPAPYNLVHYAQLAADRQSYMCDSKLLPALLAQGHQASIRHLQCIHTRCWAHHTSSLASPCNAACMCSAEGPAAASWFFAQASSVCQHCVLIYPSLLPKSCYLDIIP